MQKLPRINREQARALFEQFAPMFDRLETEGVDYCLVGGLAILVHCLTHGVMESRLTNDADLMVNRSYSNQNFAKDYLAVYASNPETSRIVYEALFGYDSFDSLSTEDAAFMNISFVGADADLDGIDTPNFDVCRTLNGKELAHLHKIRVRLFGHDIWVASINDLLVMKRDTVSLYKANYSESSRPQDFLDIETLEKLLQSIGGAHGNRP